MITQVRGSLQNQGHEKRHRRLCRVTKGKQQEKEKGGEGIHRRLSETSTAQRPRYTTLNCACNKLPWSLLS